MRVVSIASLKGGVGKTSATLGLASAALAARVPTLVVDLDPQGNATTGLGLEPGLDGVGQALVHPGSAETLPQPSPWVAAADGIAAPGVLDVLGGSMTTAEFNVPDPDATALGGLAAALRRVGSAGAGYKLVLIDCPPSAAGLTRMALAASDRMLGVAEAGLFAVKGAQQALLLAEQVRRQTRSAVQPLGVLVNRFRARQNEHRYRLEEMIALFGPLVLRPAIAERSAVQLAEGAAAPIHRWPGPAAAEVAAAYDQHLVRLRRFRLAH